MLLMLQAVHGRLLFSFASSLFDKNPSLKCTTRCFYTISTELRSTLAARESNSLVPWAVAPGAFLLSCFLRPLFGRCEDTTMTVRELRAALASMEANSDVQVVLFKNDGTSDVFELEEVLSNNGHAQLEIYEPEDTA
jgi:hypothetical protein